MATLNTLGDKEVSDAYSKACGINLYIRQRYRDLSKDESDEKIIAIPFNDPQYNEFKDISELPKHISDELKHFLSVYKQLENKKVNVEALRGHQEAIKVIEEDMKHYKEKFGGQA